MKNKKEFIGVLLGVLISVFLVGLGVYATTTISEDISVGDDLIVNGLASISETLRVPTIYGGMDSGLYLRVGDAGIASQSLSTEDDLMVTGKLEIDGVAYFDANAYFNHSSVFIKQNHSETDVTSIATSNVPLIISNEDLTSNNFAAIQFNSKYFNGSISSSLAGIGALFTDHTSMTAPTDLYFWTGSGLFGASSEKMRIKSTGEIGIGTTLPTTEFSLVGTASISQDLWASGSFQFGGGEGVATLSYSRLGSGTTGHSLADADDLLITGLLEVNDVAYFDSTVSVSSSGILMDGGAAITTGVVSPSAACTVGSLYINTAGSAGEILHICDEVNTWTLVSTN